MTLRERIGSALRWLGTRRAHGRDMRRMASEQEAGTFDGPTASRARSFEGDYHAATARLRTRMNERFPDNYHARLNARDGRPYDYGAKRAEAVDRASTAIAMALRDGATIEQAAEAGAASIGI